MISILGKEETKIITCHIGNGGSLAAVKMVNVLILLWDSHQMQV